MKDNDPMHFFSVILSFDQNHNDDDKNLIFHPLFILYKKQIVNTKKIHSTGKFSKKNCDRFLLMHENILYNNGETIVASDQLQMIQIEKYNL